MACFSVYTLCSALIYLVLIGLSLSFVPVISCACSATCTGQVYTAIQTAAAAAENVTASGALSPYSAPLVNGTSLGAAIASHSPSPSSRPRAPSLTGGRLRRLALLRALETLAPEQQPEPKPQPPPVVDGAAPVDGMPIAAPVDAPSMGSPAQPALVPLPLDKMSPVGRLRHGDAESAHDREARRSFWKLVHQMVRARSSRAMPRRGADVATTMTPQRPAARCLGPIPTRFRAPHPRRPPR